MWTLHVRRERSVVSKSDKGKSKEVESDDSRSKADTIMTAAVLLQGSKRELDR
jgi:hypothetical protein